MKGTRFLWLTAILASLSACDTRDDYFLEHGEEPVIEMKTSNDTMSSEFWEGKKYRVIEVGMGRPDTLTFSINDPYGKECSYEIKIQSLPSSNEANGVYGAELLYYFGNEALEPEGYFKYFNGNKFENRLYDTDHGNEDPCLKIKKSEGKLVFSLEKHGESKLNAIEYLREIAYYNYGESARDPNQTNYFFSRTQTEAGLVHEKPFSKEVSARYILTAKNKIGVESSEYIIVKIKPNRQPKPSITATCVNRETNEYKIIVGGTDPDGHKIVKWSYLFDYTPYELGNGKIEPFVSDDERVVYDLSYLFDGYLYYDEYVFPPSPRLAYHAEKECFYWFTFGMNEEDLIWNQKRNGKDIDFIEPTTRKEVNHIFQSKGEHTVSVRCQDEFGLWSDYITEKIFIE